MRLGRPQPLLRAQRPETEQQIRTHRSHSLTLALWLQDIKRWTWRESQSKPLLCCMERSSKKTSLKSFYVAGIYFMACRGRYSFAVGWVFQLGFQVTLRNNKSLKSANSNPIYSEQSKCKTGSDSQSISRQKHQMLSWVNLKFVSELLVQMFTAW